MKFIVSILNSTEELVSCEVMSYVRLPNALHSVMLDITERLEFGLKFERS